MTCKQIHRFTLLEMLLAVSIFALLAGLASAVLAASSRTWKLQKMEAERLQGLLAAERTADRIIRNLLPMHWNDDNHEARNVFLGDPQVMAGAYRHEADSETGSAIGYAAIGLRDHQLILQYRDAPILYFREDPLPESLREEVLLTHVETIQFLYAEYENGILVWQEDWLEEERTVLPLAVAWIITFEDGSRVTFLRRTPGASFVSSFGRRDDARIL